jgi:hypothetical protein
VTPIARRQGPTRFRSEGSASTRWRAAPFLCRAIAISGAASGTTCGNHRADFPRHPGASQCVVFAGRAHEAGSVSWTFLWAVFALQARGHWFEPSCAHQGFQLDDIFETLIGGLGITAGNHRCMLPNGGGVPGGQGRIPPAPRVSRAEAGTRRRWSYVRAAGSAVSRPAGTRLHCCEPGGWRAPGGGPGDLAGRKTGSVLDEGRLLGLVKAAAARAHADERVVGAHTYALNCILTLVVHGHDVN